MIKKITSVIICLLLCLGFCSCQSSPVNQKSTAASSAGAVSITTGKDVQYASTGGVIDYTKGDKVLIAYFSQTGTTKEVTDLLAAYTSGTVFRIETQTPYPDDSNDLLAVAADEQALNARPKIKGKIENIDQYEVVFLGFPIWCGSCPMAVLSFLEQYDLSGKTIVPFATYTHSEFGTSIENIEKSCGFKISESGLAVQNDSMDNVVFIVDRWIEKLEKEKIL